MSTAQSTQVARSTVADSWRWMWPDLLMRIIPMGAVPLLYIAFLHLPLSFLGLTLHDVPQQILIGLVVGTAMAAFAATYRMFIVGPWFRWPTLNDHLFQGVFYLLINGPVEELVFSWLCPWCRNAMDRTTLAWLARQYGSLYALSPPG